MRPVERPNCIRQKRDQCAKTHTLSCRLCGWRMLMRTTPCVLLNSALTSVLTCRLASCHESAEQRDAPNKAYDPHIAAACAQQVNECTMHGQ